MKTDTREHILGFIRQNKQARIHDLVKTFKLSNVAIHKQINKLLKDGQITKVGKPPLVFYVPKKESLDLKSPEVSTDIQKIIDNNYLYISPIGESIYGFNGFVKWAEAIKEEKRLVPLATEYVQTINETKKFVTSNGWIDATEKLKTTFPETFVDKLLYEDFYSLPKFGKTKLGQLVLYSKQSQNSELILELANITHPTINKVIKIFNIDMVAFIPPTVPRKMQFIKEFADVLKLTLPEISLVKAYSGQVVVAQKTLAKLDERIINARQTIFFKEKDGLKGNILLIDDAAGSGATFNETAKKLKMQFPKVKNIIALAIVGSFKGFDVIREV